MEQTTTAVEFKAMNDQVPVIEVAKTYFASSLPDPQVAQLPEIGHTSPTFQPKRPPNEHVTINSYQRDIFFIGFHMDNKGLWHHIHQNLSRVAFPAQNKGAVKYASRGGGGGGFTCTSRMARNCASHNVHAMQLYNRGQTATTRTTRIGSGLPTSHLIFSSRVQQLGFQLP